MANPEITIIGGGIAGLTAAHELIDRGYKVSIYEMKSIPGGKARSIEIPYAQYPHDGDKWPLPAEHGFRFFPGFYRHIVETMERIPGSRSGSKVSDALTQVHKLNYGRLDKDLISLPTKSPGNLSGILQFFKKWISQEGMDIPVIEMLSWLFSILRVSCSCDERINEQFEKISWWDFLSTDSKSTNFKRYISNGSRILVAADPRNASARTTARVNEQMLLDQMKGNADRVLDGPTNKTWIFPWVNLLLKSGRLSFYADVEVTGLIANVETGKVTSFTNSGLLQDGQCQRMIGCDPLDGPRYESVKLPERIESDQFISAVPVEVAAEYIRKNGKWTELAELAPSLKKLDELRHHVQWMNGMIFYLKDDARTIEGHSVYVDSPFALSSIFQQHYWHSQFSLSKFGKGNLTSIFSVAISNWTDTLRCEDIDHCDMPFCGRGRKLGLSASETFSHSNGLNKLKEEVWADLKQTLTIEGSALLEDRHLEHFFLDPAIHIENGVARNSEPLLVNRANSLHLRPHATTEIPNFFLAADYVQTHTDLATMEAANEAAKRAVNGLLDQISDTSCRCKIYPLERPKALRLVRWLDRLIYRIRRP